MTCDAIQNRVLALPDPRQVPGPLRDHLDACPACAAWWRRAVRLERLLERLPAPPAPADKKAALLDDLTAAGPVIKSVPAVDRGRPLFATVRALPGLKYAAGLAAAVLVAVGGWLTLRPGPVPFVEKSPAARHPLLDKLVRRDVALMRATTPDQRLDVLGGMADDLSTETRALARVASPDDLKELARLYDATMTGLGDQADKVAKTDALTPDQKKELFARLAAKLGEAGQQAELAVGESPPHAGPVLGAISKKARDGQKKLRALSERGA